MTNSKNKNTHKHSGVLIHPHNELPAEPTGALIVDISGKEPTIICVTDYTASGWDRAPKKMSIG